MDEVFKAVINGNPVAGAGAPADEPRSSASAAAWGRMAADWPALNALLDEALALPAAERGPWLAQLDATHTPLKPTLERLLSVQASIETGDFLGTLPRLNAAAALPRAMPVAEPGEVVGPWRLQRELGVGGMGSVWLAERADGTLKRPVALKLPLLGWARGLSERMARERDILATLEHPHIARLYDAGVDALGRPWLALEYVQGRPIDVYCREQALSVRQRVELLLQVCAAVAYAHSRLVVHRDLKPGNVLVTDGGQVKLLDFGIGALLEAGTVPDGTPAGTPADASPTQWGGLPMTPDYASPEQLRGETVGTASDVYSLAVVAYELLALQRPYRLRRTNAVEIAQAITDSEPAWASRTAAEPRLARQLKGDLDAILHKALKQALAERYASVEAFAEDLRRHLASQPVSAQPDALAYRATRFLRRYRLQVLAATSVALALLLGSAAAVSQALAARQAAQQEQAQRERAEAATAAARASAQEALRQADAAETERQAALAAGELARAAAADAQRQRERALLAADGERGAAREARAQTQRVQQEADRAAMVGTLMMETFARVAADPQLQREGARARLGDALDEGLKLLAPRAASAPAAVAEAHGVSASIFNYLQQPARQLAAARREQQLLQAAGESPLRIAESHRQMALALSRQRDTEGAIADAQAGLAVLPASSAQDVRVMRARLYRALGRYTSYQGRAQRAYEATRAGAQAFDGQNLDAMVPDIHHYGSALAEWAINATAVERDEEALATLARVDATYARIDVPRAADRADIELARCRVLTDLARWNEATTACRRAAELYAPQFGAVGSNADIVDVAGVRALIRAGRLAEADAVLGRVRDGKTGIIAWNESAEWALERGDLALAAGMLERMRADPLWAAGARQMTWRAHMARLWLARGRPDEAAAEARTALAQSHSQGGGRREQRSLQLLLAEAESANGSLEAARSAWRAACGEADPPPATGSARARCADVAVRLALAEGRPEQAVADVPKPAGRTPSELAHAWQAQAQALLALGRLPQARAALLAAAPLVAAHHPASPLLAEQARLQARMAARD